MFRSQTGTTFKHIFSNRNQVLLKGPTYTQFLIFQLCRTDRRKEVGVKLLEITDQPLGYAAMKKKRKQEVNI